MHFLKSIALASGIVAASCADIDLQKEIEEYCVEHPETALCSSTPDLADEIEEFCIDNPQTVLCVDASATLTQIMEYCAKAPEDPFCQRSSSLGDLCVEKPDLALCQESSNPFVMNSSPTTVSQEERQQGDFFTITGEHVSYLKQTRHYDDGTTVTEIVFLQSVTRGLLLEVESGQGVAKFIPAAIPPFGNVSVAEVVNLSFYALFQGEEKNFPLCDTQTLSVRYSGDSPAMLFSVYDTDGNIVAEVERQEGEYAFLPAPQCSPSDTFLVANSGGSSVVGVLLNQKEILLVDTYLSCLSAMFAGDQSMSEFFIPGYATPDGHLRYLSSAPADPRRVCADAFDK